MSREKGNIGESDAIHYLNEKGYVVIERNYYSRFGEIDIVALDQETVVFVEVKTGKEKENYRPIESITKAKLRKLIKTIDIYVHVNKLHDKDIRIDGIEIIYKRNNSMEITHYKSLSF